jgi:lysophospholipase L1-like esterase
MTKKLLKGVMVGGLALTCVAAGLGQAASAQTTPGAGRAAVTGAGATAAGVLGASALGASALGVSALGVSALGASALGASALGASATGASVLGVSALGASASRASAGSPATGASTSRAFAVGAPVTGASVAGAAGAGTAARSDQADAAVWTGTWAAAPQSSGASFGTQTLRQIVHTSISGSAARVDLSNAFGSRPVTIADVHVADRTSGSSVDPATDHAVTFGGATSVTIPAGQKAVSDQVALAVGAGQDVAVSFFLPQAVTNATQHQLGEQTNYVANGDVAGSANLSNPQTNGSYTFLSGLDVQNSAASGAVVALGASITDGIASAGDANRRWPNDLSVRLNQSGRTVGVLNEGISGNALLHDGAGQSAINRFQRDVLDQPNVKWVIFADDPINDVNNSNPPTGQQLIDGVTQIINAAHAHGVKFLCATLTPFKPDSGWTQAGENSREAYDSFVRSANSGCDGVVDFDAAVHNTADPATWNPAYDSGDHLHPNTDGLQTMANAVNLTLFN